MSHYFILFSVMSLQGNIVRCQVLISGSMLNDQRDICLYYTSSCFKSIVGVYKLDGPVGVIRFVVVHTDFLFPWFAWIGSCADRDTVKIQGFLIKVVISCILYFLPVMHEVVSELVVFIRSSLNSKHRSSTRSNVLIRWIYYESFVIWKNLRSNINYQEPTCLFIEQHKLISKSKFTILWECLRHLQLHSILPFCIQNWTHPKSY
jgi:hypothetical protein